MEPEIPFVHLHVHTQYSLLDGAIRIDHLLRRAREFDMGAVAITDHGTMFGTVEFYDKAVKAGINPVIGCECYLAPRRLSDKTPLDHKGLTHLILLAENQEGYRNLCKLATVAQLEGFYYKPRIDREVLKACSGGIIALSACLHGEIPRLIQEGNAAGADEAARFYLSVFGEDRFFLEVQHNGIPVQGRVNEALYDMSERLSIPLVATNDCHYLDPADARAHDALLCIQTGKTIHETDRFRFGTEELYFKPKAEMTAYFADRPEALRNTVRIAERCRIEFDFDSYHFPKFGATDGKNTEEIFSEAARAGFEKVFTRIRKKNPEADERLYSERLEYEISMINKMEFPGYFLIVSDFIRFAKEKGIPVGPGRGSAAGSLVAYALGITDLDPIAHGLIFERFLNPARLSMPDIDVDFCINGREEVFNYVVNRYGGGDYVAQIITFGKLKTRAVIRDVGRALDIPLREVDAIAKMVPDVLNISLEDALKLEPRLNELAADKPEIAELIRICRTLEGLPRHASTHAAGVVISDRPLVEYLPLYRGKKGEVVTQLDMKLVEKIGLVKFDFLGLRNLTVIADAISLIAAQGKAPPDLSDLDLGDPAIYRLLCSGDTTGVFQLESSGMKDLLVRLKPACFEDVVALVALYRPGPLESGMSDDFVERKHGRKKVEYIVPELESILKETYGVIVYQEQVMKIAGALASYSMAEADDLRKAMGKKIKEVMAKHRERFVQGAVRNGIPGARAQTIFDLMEKFGGYGFNKSHSAAYALITCQTAFLKAHFPVEFMAALLTSEMSSIEGVVKYAAECRSHGIQVLPPDINESRKAFTVSGESIRFGLVAVKNVGEGAIDAIIEARKDGRFASLFEFCERVDLRKVNKRVAESLIKCGAFDSTCARRACMMAALDDAFDFGQRIQKERIDPQMGLFDTGPDEAAVLPPPPMPDLPEWEERELLAFEKESLGFYIAGHPLRRFEDLLRKFTSASSLELKDLEAGQAVRLGGIVKSTKVIKTKKGDLMAFAVVEDMYGTFEITVFSSVYGGVSGLLAEDTPILIQGQAQKDENSVKILADTIIPIEKAEETWIGVVRLDLEAAGADRDKLMKIRSLLEKYPGGCPVRLHLIDAEQETVIALSDALRIKPVPELLKAAKELLGDAAVATLPTEITLSSQHSKSSKPHGQKFGSFNA